MEYIRSGQEETLRLPLPHPLVSDVASGVASSTGGKRDVAKLLFSTAIVLLAGEHFGI
jgi:hypothetical protein